MLMLELPHINVLSKIDILKKQLPEKHQKRVVDQFLEMDVRCACTSHRTP